MLLQNIFCLIDFFDQKNHLVLAIFISTMQLLYLLDISIILKVVDRKLILFVCSFFEIVFQKKDV